MTRLTQLILTVTCMLFANATKLPLEELDSIKISLLPETDIHLNVSNKEKSILRYGFHRTQDCQEFEKAFICVRKCLDLNYQIAHADKDCICTCYKNNILAQYKLQNNIGSTKWKLGAPTTTRPAWAGPYVEKMPKDYEINENFYEYAEDSNEYTESKEDEEEYEDQKETSEGSGDTTTTTVTDDATSTGVTDDGTTTGVTYNTKSAGVTNNATSTRVTQTATSVGITNK